MTPQTKKLASAFAVTVAVAILGTLNVYVVRLPAELQAGALAIIAGAAHFANAWGHQAREDEAVAAKLDEIIKAES